jgi:arylsulfatase A-like enzyme
VDMERALRSSIPYLPQVLQQSGFRTAVFSTIAQISPATGYGRGVDHFVDLSSGSALSDRRTFTRDADGLPDRSRLPRSSELGGLFADWLSEDGAPFFAMLWCTDTHVPYVLPEGGGRFAEAADAGEAAGSLRSLRHAESEADAQRITDLYDSLIFSNDRALGEVLSGLKDKGLYDDTLIVAAADHGEVFNEYGRLSHTPAARWLRVMERLPTLRAVIRRYRLVNPYGWLGHLDLIPYEEVLRVPLVIKQPRQRSAGARILDSVGLIDVAPTVYELLSVEPSGGPLPPSQGISLMPLMGCKRLAADRRYLFSDSQALPDATRYLSVQDGDWKLLRMLPPLRSGANASLSGRALLGRLVRWSGEDILTRRGDCGGNLASRHPRVARRLAVAMDAWLAEGERLAEIIGEESPRVSDEVMRRLRHLGYVS